jgi:hypothetical protein
VPSSYRRPSLIWKMRGTDSPATSANRSEDALLESHADQAAQLSVAGVECVSPAFAQAWP